MLCLGRFWYFRYSWVGGGDLARHKTSKPNTTFLFIKDIIPGNKTKKEKIYIFPGMKVFCIKNNNTKVIEYRDPFCGMKSEEAVHKYICRVS